MGPVPPDIDVATLADPGDVEAVVEEWDALGVEAGGGPCARPTFALTWWRHLGSGRLLIGTVRHGGRLVALAPLHERRVGPVSVVRWLGHGLGTVAEALVAPGHEGAATALWSSIATRRRLLQLVECRDGTRGLPQAGAVPGRTVTSTRDVCPVIDLGEASAAGYMDDPARRRIRRTLRVADRRLADAGLDHRVEVADDPQRLDALLPAIEEVYDAAETDRPRQHLLRPPWRDFTRDLLTRATASGEAAALVLFVGGRPAAFDLALLTEASMHSWVGRFHPRAASFSPGHLLQRAGLAWAESQRLTRIDLLLGDAPYKRLWSNCEYRTVEVTHGRRPMSTAAGPLLRAVARRHTSPAVTPTGDLRPT